MLFRQRILKAEIVKFIVTNVCMLMLWIPLVLIGLIRDRDAKAVLMMTALLPPLFLFLILMGLNCLEWYDVYEDRIEAKCIWGRKNIVYYHEVQFVELAMIGIARGIQKPFYIFNDGRKNNSSILDINSPSNKKKFNLRIHYSPEMENHILNTLGMPIISK